MVLFQRRFFILSKFIAIADNTQWFFYFMISEEGLQKFIELYKKKYSVELSKQEAFKIFSQLIFVLRDNK